MASVVVLDGGSSGCVARFMNWCALVEGGVMLARGKTPAEVGTYPGCCCYCDLYSLAEWAYRDKLSYPAAPFPYSPMPPCPEHGGQMPPPEGVPALHPHKHISPDVATAFLLSLDLLRPYPHQQALSALESHALKHACEFCMSHLVVVEGKGCTCR